MSHSSQRSRRGTPLRENENVKLPPRLRSRPALGSPLHEDESISSPSQHQSPSESTNNVSNRSIANLSNATEETQIVDRSQEVQELPNNDNDHSNSSSSDNEGDNVEDSSDPSTDSYDNDASHNNKGTFNYGTFKKFMLHKYCFLRRFQKSQWEKIKKMNRWLLGLIIIISVGVVGEIATTIPMGKETYTIENLKKDFECQLDSFYLAIESGVRDVANFNRPVSFILMYKEESEMHMWEYLHYLSKFVTCNLTDCSKKFLYVPPKMLNSMEMMEDYGRLIEKFRARLKDTGVMVITNFEESPGITAQAFHSFCDEFTPLVERAVFIFTVKVDDFRKNNAKYLEEYFREKWSDLKIDIFRALWTRISSMILEVRSCV